MPMQSVLEMGSQWRRCRVREVGVVNSGHGGGVERCYEEEDVKLESTGFCECPCLTSYECHHFFEVSSAWPNGRTRRGTCLRSTCLLWRLSHASSHVLAIKKTVNVVSSHWRLPWKLSNLLLCHKATCYFFCWRGKISLKIIPRCQRWTVSLD